ncbi:hypothetical protein ASD11_04175 [Aeromicrobium sp. Root495]|uniref:hypothetical protein n=1 Tax=Aeromicrobium sp. Root495 TaxID=1736550 RepID=UPI0006F358C1|nr:hypothetical protein [Aeromicrobium sp. Root495]KQY58836.1 hypothetical protein ASD11_04175 [Aeromicrobium sp. Root495]
MALLPGNPAAILNRADKVLVNVDGVLGRVDGTLGSVDTTLEEVKVLLAEVKGVLTDLTEEIELVKQLPAMAEQLAQIHAAVTK